MASAQTGDISEWEGIDMDLIKERFTWACTSTKTGSEAKMSTMKKMVSKATQTNMDTGAFAKVTRDSPQKSVPWNKFKTKAFWVTIAGSEAAAQKECKKLMADETARKAAAGGKNAAVVDRLTDTSKYTGAHKERFDASGKGKGGEGRRDEVKNTGYVGNYKGEGTYKGN